MKDGRIVIALHSEPHLTLSIIGGENPKPANLISAIDLWSHCAIAFRTSEQVMIQGVLLTSGKADLLRQSSDRWHLTSQRSPLLSTALSDNETALGC
ncbi:MAG: hypothetical protein F6K26_37145 [Moorea sp. SIO2I5]|nr:hypothetical protein [Moorena sp. SIO2I5]